MSPRITDKDKIMELAIEYLKTNNRIDIWSFIINDMAYFDAPQPFIWDVAHKMERTGEYAIDTYSIPHYLYVKPLPLKKKTWAEEHPILHDIRTAGIGAGFSLLVGIILWLIANQKQDRLEEIQNKRIDTLSDSIKMIQKNMPHLSDTSTQKSIPLLKK